MKKAKLNSSAMLEPTTKRWLVQKYMGRISGWQKYSKLCLTRDEAEYIMGLLERNANFEGTVGNYRLICISI